MDTKQDTVCEFVDRVVKEEGEAGAFLLSIAMIAVATTYLESMIGRYATAGVLTCLARRVIRPATGQDATSR